MDDFNSQNTPNPYDNVYMQNSEQQPSTSSAPLQNYYEAGEIPPKKGTTTFAIISMILGILSVVSCCIWYISAILALAGLIFGIISVVQKNPGKGMAIAGIICSAVGIVFSIALIVFFAVPMISLAEQFGMTVEEFFQEIVNGNITPEDLM